MFLRLKHSCFLFAAFLHVVIVTGDFDCLCNYNVETKVYWSASSNASLIGYMYEFDCKALYMMNITGDFFSVQINNKVGYVLNGSGIQIQTCQGSPDPSDKVDPATLSTLAPVQPSQYSSTTVSAIKTSTTTMMPTTSTPQTTSTTPTTTSSTTTMTSTTTTMTSTTPTTTSTTPTTTSVSKVVTTNTSPTSQKPSQPPTTTTPLQPKTTTSLLGNIVSSLSSRAVITATPSNSTSVYACFPGWVLYGESCYLFHTDARYTWYDSQVFCRIHHADLVSIDTGNEQSFIEAALKNAIDPGQDFAGVWTAGSDLELKGQWVWNLRNVSKDILAYQNWAPGQPSDGVDDCLNIDGKLQYQWDDNWCDDKMYYICERSAHYHTDTAVQVTMVPSVAPTVIQTQPSIIQITTTQPPPTPVTTTQQGTMQPTTGQSSLGVTACFPGWELYKESCYLFHTDSRYTWEESEVFCRIHHADLVAIDTVEEQRFIEAWFKTLFDPGQDFASAWTAGTDQENKGQWVWDLRNANKDIQAYQNWAPGQPSDGVDDCLNIDGKLQYQWDDNWCDDKMYYICERSAHYHTDTAINGSSGIQTQPPAIITTTPPPPTTQPVTMQPTTGPYTGGSTVCFPGWALYKDSCYLFHTDSRYTWEESKTFCDIHHSNLVAIETIDEQMFLKKALSNISSLANYQTAVSSGLWTAGSDEDMEDRWIWINDFNGDKLMQGYDNWSPGQPDDGHSGSDQDCLSLVGIRQFEWSDYHCDDKMFYICERSAHYHVDVANSIVG